MKEYFVKCPQGFRAQLQKGVECKTTREPFYEAKGICPYEGACSSKEPAASKGLKVNACVYPG